MNEKYKCQDCNYIMDSSERLPIQWKKFNGEIGIVWRCCKCRGPLLKLEELT